MLTVLSNSSYMDSNTNQTQSHNHLAGFCREDTTPQNIAYACFLILIAILTVLGNIAICCSIYHNQSLHRFSNYLVASLAFSDLIVAFFSLPMRIHQTLNNTHWCLSKGTCVFWIWIDLACRCTSFANLGLISIDRFVATRYPLKYHRIITKRGSCLMLVYIWFHGIVISSLGLTNWTNSIATAFAIDSPLGCRKTVDPFFYTFATCAGFFAPLVVIGASYCYVFSISWEHWKSTSRVTFPEPLSFTQGNIASNRFALTREIKAAKTLAIVIAALVCCWFPVFVILLVLLWCSACFPHIIPFVNITFIYILPNITSALNPFIFFTFSRKLRQSFSKFCIDVNKYVQSAKETLYE